MGNEKDVGKLTSFLKGSVILVISNICLKAINFLLMPLYTKHLTTEMMGTSDVITSFVGLLFPILVMGLDSAFSAFYFDDDDKDRSSRVFNTIMFSMIILGVIPIIGIAFSKQIATLLFGSSEYYIAVIIALCSVSFNIWYLPLALEVRMKNKMMLFGLVNISASFVMVLLNILFVVYLKLGAESLIVSTAIVQLFELILYKILTRARLNRQLVDKMLLKKMLRFALPLLPSVIMVWVLSLSDRYFILYFFSEAEVGIYGIGARFVLLLNVVITGVTTAYTTFAFGNKSNPNAKQQYARVLNTVAFLLVAACFTVSLFSKELVNLLTAPSYHSAYKILRNMLFAQMMYGVTSIVSYGIYFEKKPIYSLLASFCGAAANVSLNLVFIPRYGIEAAACTTLIGYSITFAISYISAQKLYHCDYGIKRILVVVLLLYLVSWASMEIGIVFKALIWLAVAIATCFVFQDVVKEIITLIVKPFSKLSRKGAKE